MPVPQRDHRRLDTPSQPGGGGGCLWAMLGVVLTVGLAVALLVMFPAARGGDLDWTRFAYLTALLAVIIVSLGGAFRGNPGRTLRYAGIWIGIGAILSLGYAFRGELGMVGDRLAGNLAPARGVVSDKGREVTLFAREDGHFYVEAEVEGKQVLFVVDTGASDVVLTRRDAERVGIEPEERDFTRIYQTANGAVTGAPVVLDSVAIGPIDLRNVEASVNSGPMGVSLLGMTFLGRLDSYRVKRDRLTLRQ